MTAQRREQAPRPGRGRVIPLRPEQVPQAESALIGALGLGEPGTRDRIRATGLRPAHFLSDPHGDVYGLALSMEGEPDYGRIIDLCPGLGGQVREDLGTGLGTANAEAWAADIKAAALLRGKIRSAQQLLTRQGYVWHRPDSPVADELLPDEDSPIDLPGHSGIDVLERLNRAGQDICWVDGRGLYAWLRGKWRLIWRAVAEPREIHHQLDLVGGEAVPFEEKFIYRVRAATKRQAEAPYVDVPVCRADTLSSSPKWPSTAASIPPPGRDNVAAIGKSLDAGAIWAEAAGLVQTRFVTRVSGLMRYRGQLLFAAPGVGAIGPKGIDPNFIVEFEGGTKGRLARYRMLPSDPATLEEDFGELLGVRNLTGPSHAAVVHLGTLGRAVVAEELGGPATVIVDGETGGGKSTVANIISGAFADVVGPDPRGNVLVPMREATTTEAGIRQVVYHAGGFVTYLDDLFVAQMPEQTVGASWRLVMRLSGEAESGSGRAIASHNRGDQQSGAARPPRGLMVGTAEALHLSKVAESSRPRVPIVKQEPDQLDLVLRDHYQTPEAAAAIARAFTAHVAWLMERIQTDQMAWAREVLELQQSFTSAIPHPRGARGWAQLAHSTRLMLRQHGSEDRLWPEIRDRFEDAAHQHAVEMNIGGIRAGEEEARPKFPGVLEAWRRSFQDLTMGGRGEFRVADSADENTHPKMPLGFSAEQAGWEYRVVDHRDGRTWEPRDHRQLVGGVGETKDGRLQFRTRRHLLDAMHRKILAYAKGQSMPEDASEIVRMLRDLGLAQTVGRKLTGRSRLWETSPKDSDPEPLYLLDWGWMLGDDPPITNDGTDGGNTETPPPGTGVDPGVDPGVTPGVTPDSELKKEVLPRVTPISDTVSPRGGQSAGPEQEDSDGKSAGISPAVGNAVAGISAASGLRTGGERSGRTGPHGEAPDGDPRAVVGDPAGHVRPGRDPAALIAILDAAGLVRGAGEPRQLSPGVELLADTLDVIRQAGMGQLLPAGPALQYLGLPAPERREGEDVGEALIVRGRCPSLDAVKARGWTLTHYERDELGPWSRAWHPELGVDRNGKPHWIDVHFAELEPRADRRFSPEISGEALLEAARFMARRIGRRISNTPGQVFESVVRKDRGALDVAKDVSDQLWELFDQGLASEMMPTYSRALTPEEEALPFIIAFDRSGSYAASMGTIDLGKGDLMLLDQDAAAYRLEISGDQVPPGMWRIRYDHDADPMRTRALIPALDHPHGWAAHPLVELLIKEQIPFEVLEAAIWSERLPRYYSPFQKTLSEARWALYEHHGEPWADAALAVLKGGYTGMVGRLRSRSELIRAPRRPDVHAAVMGIARANLSRRISKATRLPVAYGQQDMTSWAVSTDDPEAAAAELGIPYGRQLGRFHVKAVLPMAAVLDRMRGRRRPVTIADAIAGLVGGK